MTKERLAPLVRTELLSVRNGSAGVRVGIGDVSHRLELTVSHGGRFVPGILDAVTVCMDVWFAEVLAAFTVEERAEVPRLVTELLIERHQQALPKAPDPRRLVHTLPKLSKEPTVWRAHRRGGLSAAVR